MSLENLVLDRLIIPAVNRYFFYFLITWVLGIVSIFEGEVMCELLISQLYMTMRTCHGRIRQTYLFGFCKVPIWHKAVLVMFSE